MKNILLYLGILIMVLHASEPSLAKIVKLSSKGEKVAKLMCDAKKLPTAKGTIDDIMKNIRNSGACKKLNRRNLEALAYYISNGSMKLSKQQMHVPNGAKCPVCGMFVYKYPKWAASMEISGKKHYFDGVKDMMKFYIFDVDFPYDRGKISKMEVSDFYTLEAIPAVKAWYVYDSEFYGPMGRELIPFKTKEAAEEFSAQNRGKEILRFDQITPQKVMALDGIEME